MQVKKQQLELDMEKQTGSKLGKEYIKAAYCQPAYLAYMQSTSCKMLVCINCKLESRLLGEILITSGMPMTSPLMERVKRNLSLSKLKEESEKSWIKIQNSKNIEDGIWSHYLMENRWRNNENRDILYFVGLQNHYGW